MSAATSASSSAIRRSPATSASTASSIRRISSSALTRNRSLSTSSCSARSRRSATSGASSVGLVGLNRAYGIGAEQRRSSYPLRPCPERPRCRTTSTTPSCASTATHRSCGSVLDIAAWATAAVVGDVPAVRADARQRRPRAASSARCRSSPPCRVLFGYAIGLYRRRWRYGSYDEVAALVVTAARHDGRPVPAQRVLLRRTPDPAERRARGRRHRSGADGRRPVRVAARARVGPQADARDRREAARLRRRRGRPPGHHRARCRTRDSPYVPVGHPRRRPDPAAAVDPGRPRAGRSHARSRRGAADRCRDVADRGPVGDRARRSPRSATWRSPPV